MPCSPRALTVPRSLSLCSSHFLKGPHLAPCSRWPTLAPGAPTQLALCVTGMTHQGQGLVTPLHLAYAGCHRSKHGGVEGPYARVEIGLATTGPQMAKAPMWVRWGQLHLSRPVQHVHVSWLPFLHLPAEATTLSWSCLPPKGIGTPPHFSASPRGCRAELEGSKQCFHQGS